MTSGVVDHRALDPVAFDEPPRGQGRKFIIRHGALQNCSQNNTLCPPKLLLQRWRKDLADEAQQRGACRKLWPRPQDGPGLAPFLGFVNLWKSEAECEQPVLLQHRPRARKAKA